MEQIPLMSDDQLQIASLLDLVLEEAVTRRILSMNVLGAGDAVLLYSYLNKLHAAVADRLGVNPDNTKR